MWRVGGSMVAITLLAVYLAAVSWPDGSGKIRVLGDFWIVTAGRNVRLLLVALFAGALGGALSSVMVLGNFLGNRYLEAAWLPWFLLRPGVGASLAVVLYLVLRVGLFSSTASADDVRTIGVAIVGLFAGIYSKQATSKVREVFEMLFPPPRERRSRNP